MAKALVVQLILAGATLAPCCSLAFDPLDTSNRYDYVILAHDSFQAEAGRLLSHRSAGLRACLVLTSEVSAAFSGANDVEKIRAFVLYAYENWKIAPMYLLLIGDMNMDVTQPEIISPTSNNFLPAHLTYNGFYAWQGNHLFAEDGWYVESPVAEDKHPIMHIGRLSVRTNVQLAHIIDKIIYYDGLTGTPSWLGRIVMLVGDANINHNNAIYRTINDQMFDEELAGWTPAPTRLYSADFWPGQWPEGATAATKSQFDSGCGFVNAFGNTIDDDYLVYMAEFFPAGAPTFSESLNPTNYLPLVFAGSCLPNHFYRNGPPDGLALSEDLLFKANNRGAIAVVGPAHVNDIIECKYVNQSFLHLMVHEGVRNIGQLFSAAKTLYLAEPFAQEMLIRQFMLMGDPAIDIKLQPLPTPSKYLQNMEIEDALVLQDHVIGKSAGITDENARVIHIETGIPPAVSERMLRIRMTDAPGSADYIEWKIGEDLAVGVERNTVLSFKINIIDSPSGNDKFAVDGNTSVGRIKDQIQIIDQYGQSLDAKLRVPLAAGWQTLYADLTPLQGAVLQDVRVRYETTVAGESGSLRVLLDDISVAPIDMDELQEVLNLSFEVDRDENGTPDFWTDTNGASVTSVVLRRDDLPAVDGDAYMQVFDAACAGRGAQHIFHANSDVLYYRVSCAHYAPDPSAFRLKIIDAQTGGVILDSVINSASVWNEYETTFENPGYLLGTRRIKLQFLPEDCAHAFYVDRVLVSEQQAIGVEIENGSSDRGDGSVSRTVRAWPNPFNPTTRIAFIVPKRGRATLEISDARGRVVATPFDELTEPGTHEITWNATSVAGRKGSLASGVYFYRVMVGGRSESGRLVLVK